MYIEKSCIFVYSLYLIINYTVYVFFKDNRNIFYFLFKIIIIIMYLYLSIWASYFTCYVLLLLAKECNYIVLMTKEL